MVADCWLKVKCDVETSSSDVSCFSTQVDLNIYATIIAASFISIVGESRWIRIVCKYLHGKNQSLFTHCYLFT